MGKKRTKPTMGKRTEIFTVRGTCITDELKKQIFQAVQGNKKILVRDEILFSEVIDIVAESGVTEFQVSLLNESRNPTKKSNSKELLFGT